MAKSKSKTLSPASGVPASEKTVHAFTGAPANHLRNQDGDVVKVILFDDPIEDAVAEALQEIVMHPQGNVDDESYWLQWSKDLIVAVARKAGVQDRFVFVSFHRDDRLGVVFEDTNTVRVRVKVGGEVRHTVLIDPTPED